jgi:hypothetical protein
MANDKAVNNELPEVQKPAKELQAADQAFADKLARRPPPNEIDRAAIDQAIKRTRARAPRIEMHIEDRGSSRRFYADHSDENGNRYRLADVFGTRSLQFVNSMLKGVGRATEDHSESNGFGPGRTDQLAFNAALAAIGGVRPKDEIESMLAAHMAVANIALLDLVARTREAAAGHLYHGEAGTRRLEVLGNLTNKFMRTYTMQCDALTRKRRKVSEQRVTVKHVHVHPGGQAIVGNVNHSGGRGTTKNGQRPYGRAPEAAATAAIPKRSPVRGANKEREAMPIARDRKGAVSAARWRKR